MLYIKSYNQYIFKLTVDHMATCTCADALCSIELFKGDFNLNLFG